MVITSTPPSVFISSTVKEFRDLRSAIAYTLRIQGFTVHQSEAADFDIKGDRSAFEECFANIRDCDFYILLVGSTRGNLFKDGVSITRQEYRIARDAFLSTGRPRLLFYLLEAAEVALQGNQKVQSAAGIDDPDHLASFIDEIQRPKIEGTPNYLTRFRDFENVMNSLASRMNLGRTLSEKLIRHSLLSELLSNLTLMVERSGTSAFPRHWYMSKARENIQLVPKNLNQNVLITDDQVISLGFSLVGRTRGENLKTRSIEDALDRGVFLTFNPTNGTLQESPLHKALQQTFRDIQTLRHLDTPTAQEKWDISIATAISARWQGRPNSLAILGYDLASALAHYDLVENVFRGHLALCQVLLGLSEELPSYQRQPLTPLGEQEEQKIHAERVSEAEISQLIQNNIWPFGTRVSKEVYGKTRADQVKKITDDMYTTLTNLGIDVDQYKDIRDILEGTAEEYLDKHTALPEEGIEDRKAK